MSEISGTLSFIYIVLLDHEGANWVVAAPKVLVLAFSV